MRRSLVALTTAALLLTVSGCGSGETSSLDGVEVTGEGTPKVDVGTDFAVDETVSDVLEDGAGDEVAEGDTVKVNYIAVNGRTGKEFDNSYANDRPMVLTLNETALPGFSKGLTDKKVGSRVLIAVTGEDGASLLQGPSDLGLEESDTMVFLFDIVAKIPQEASGEEQEAAANSPEVTYDEDGHPSGVTKSDTSPEAFEGAAAAQVLVKGEGEKVESGQTLVTQYVGSQYPGGEVFDSSWERDAPATFAIGQGQVIPCWDETLVGQTIGSRVLLTCPVATAYGENAAEQGRPAGDLTFVVDVLDAF